MREKQAASLETLNGLLAERERYEQWLAALENRRASTSDAVYQKVRGDYETRLREVSERIASRADELRSSIDSLGEKLRELAQQETFQREAAQEAELRAAVGEYSEDEWTRIKQESEKELGRIAKDRTTSETRLAELNRIVAISAGQAPAPAPVSAPSAPVQAPPRSPASAPAAASAPKRNPASGWPQRDGDPVVTTPAAPSNSSSDGKGSPFDDFAGLATPKGSADGVTQKSPAPAPPASLPTKSRRGGLPEMRTEQQKTLKCPECGAANYPTSGTANAVAGSWLRCRERSTATEHDQTVAERWSLVACGKNVLQAGYKLPFRPSHTPLATTPLATVW
jgi:Chromosome segregation ATPases